MSTPRQKAVDLDIAFYTTPRKVVITGIEQKHDKEASSAYSYQKLTSQTAAVEAIGRAISVNQTTLNPFNINTVSYYKYKESEEKVTEAEEHMIISASCEPNWIHNQLLKEEALEEYQNKYGVTVHLATIANTKLLKKNTDEKKNPLGYGEIRETFTLVSKEEFAKAHSLILSGAKNTPNLGYVRKSVADKKKDIEYLSLNDSQKRILGKHARELPEDPQDLQKLRDNIRSIVKDQKKNYCPYKCCEPLAAALLEAKIQEAEKTGHKIKIIEENNFKYKSGLKIQLQDACEECQKKFGHLREPAGKRNNLIPFNQYITPTTTQPTKLDKSKKAIEIIKMNIRHIKELENLQAKNKEEKKKEKKIKLSSTIESTPSVNASLDSSSSLFSPVPTNIKTASKKSTSANTSLLQQSPQLQDPAVKPASNICIRISSGLKNCLSRCLGKRINRP